jgi:hypothetical protein
VKVCNILSILSHLYGYEICLLKQRDKRGLKAAEMKFMRRKAGHRLLDHRRKDILEHKVDPVAKKLEQ